jgi:glycosyltransferase involved in cell wall biosynthesis
MNQASPDRLRVLMIATCPFPTSQGSQTLIKQLASGLTEQGHSVDLVAYHHGEYHQEFPFRVHRAARVPFINRLKAGPSISKLFMDFLIWAQARAVGRSLKPDIVHGHNYEGALIGAFVARELRVPLAYHTHNVMHEELPTYYSYPLLQAGARYIGLALDKWIPKLADHIIAINTRLKVELEELGVSAGKITIVPPGIWSDEWPSDEATEEEPFVVYTGNLDNYQNLRVLIEGMSHVVRQIPDAVLIIVSHERNKNLERHIRQRGLGASIDLVTVNDFAAVRRWIRRSSVAVCPRIPTCGYPIKLVNYLAAGKPVVVSRACADGIEHGKTGLVVDTNDPSAYADAIISLLRDRRLASAVGAAGRRMALEKHSWEGSLTAVERAYRQALNAMPSENNPSSSRVA